MVIAVPWADLLLTREAVPMASIPKWEFQLRDVTDDLDGSCGLVSLKARSSTTPTIHDPNHS